MTDKEVNKVIADFMEWSEVKQEFWAHKFCKSLDALVPVWKKLESWESANVCSIKLIGISSDSPYCMLHDVECSDSEGKTIQQAAAHATAKSILELQKEEND